ncbi:MAG: carboxypeptidase-like regulatory domain-containing protein [Chitinophagaceae bacterium]
MFVCRDECCSVPVIPDPGSEPGKFMAKMAVHVEVNAAGVPVKLDGKIKDAKLNTPIKELPISIKGTTTETVTAANGSFSFDLKGETLILILSMKGYVPVEVTIGADTIFDLEFTPVEEVVVVGMHPSGIEPQKLNKGCGCSDIEYVLQSSPAFEGETVAEPATSRSILVSVPQHIIIPFEEPVRPSPCDERRKKRLELVAEGPIVKLPAQKKDADRKSKRKPRRTKKDK